MVAGTGYSGFDSESGPATASRINGPAGMFLDSAGVLYFADSGNGRIRKVANGTLTTHLGGTSDSTANPALLYLPTAVLVDPAGVVYVADTGNHRIRKLNPNLTITTVAGNGHDLAFDLNGSILEAGGTILQRLTPGNTLVTIIGNVLFSFHGDGGPATNAALNIPVGVASDGASALWVSDFGNGRVRRISPDGIISTVAGGLITDTLQRPSGLALDSNGTLYVTDPAIDEIMQMPLNGRLTNIAGTGSPGSSGDGGPARFAMLSSPSGIAIDGVGQVIIADTGNNRLRRIKTDGTMAPFAGNAQLLTPTGLCSGLNGDIFVADTGNHMVRRIAVDGTVSALAGNGVQGYSGDTGSANAASLDAPRGCAVDPQGNVFIADTGNHVIRLVTLDGKIWTIAGTGTPGFSGDGGLALQAALHSPCSVALDTNGTVYVADKDNNRIRRLKPVGLSFGEITQTIGYANGASQQSGPVAPGSLISIFGSGLGPLMAIPGTLQSPGVLANQLGDTQVLFDGIPGALLLVQDSQINAVVPFEVAGRMASKVEVRRSGLAIGSTTVPIAAVAPGLFTLDAGTGLAFAFNADGSANSSNNPAAQGTAVTLYGTGGGQTFPAGTDGRVPDASPYPLVLPVSATIAGQPANVAWAGETPGQAGVNTFQLTVPSTAPTGPQPVVLMIGGMSSQPGALIYVQ